MLAMSECTNIWQVLMIKPFQNGIDGNTSKIHLAVDANRHSIKFVIGDDMTYDVKVTPDLINFLDSD